MCILSCFYEKIQWNANFHRYVDIYRYTDISAIFFFRYIDIIDTLNGVSMTALAWNQLSRVPHTWEIDAYTTI